MDSRASATKIGILGELIGVVGSSVHLPGAQDYADARSSSNGAAPRQPAYVVHCRNVDEVRLTVRAARIAIGGIATRPWRARAAEQVLTGKTLTPQTAREAGDAALQGAKPGHDNGFRIELGARTVADALMIAKQRT